jgi:hypothetical protein
VKVNEPFPFAEMNTAKVLLPVLCGDPGHALGVHGATSCATALRSVQVSCTPVCAVAASGLKQNEMPPPVHVPDEIVMVVAAFAVSTNAMPESTDAAIAPSSLSSPRASVERLCAAVRAPAARGARVVRPTRPSDNRPSSNVPGVTWKTYADRLQL